MVNSQQEVSGKEKYRVFFSEKNLEASRISHKYTVLDCTETTPVLFLLEMTFRKKHPTASKT